MGGLNRIFGVVPWLFLLAGLGAFGLGGYILLGELRASQALEEVARGPQPPAIPIESFDPASDIHAAQEVHVSGQLDLSMQYDLVAPGADGAGDFLGVMIPVYGVTAAGIDEPALGVLLYDQGPGGVTIGEVEVNTLIAQIDGEGAVGPYISVAGRAAQAGRYEALIQDAFAQNDRATAENLLTIAPFRAGRLADLSAGPALEQPFMLGMGGTIGILLAMIGFARRRNRKPAEQDPDKADAADSHAEEGVAPDFDMDADSGLVFIAAYGPEMADGSTGTALMRDVLALGRRSDESGVYAARRDGIDEFAALDSGGLKRPLAGRAVSEKIAGPKPVKKESPLAARQDPTQAADIMAAVQAEISTPVTRPVAGDMGDIFAAVQAAVGTQVPTTKPMSFSNAAVEAAQNPFGK